MIIFDEDESLGKVVSKKELQSFGDKPIDSLKQIVYAAGGDKLSNLCKFKFTSAATQMQYNEFCIAFVCKLRSKIFRQNKFIPNKDVDPEYRWNIAPSQWYIFKIISDKEVHCLSKKNLLDQYGFDIDKFYQSDYFKNGVEQFKTTIKNAIKTKIPEFIKKHGNEKAKDSLTSWDGKVDATVKDVTGRYVLAIENSLDYIDNTRTNDKFYKLISYTDSVFEADDKIIDEDSFDEEEFEANLDKAIEEALKDIYK